MSGRKINPSQVDREVHQVFPSKVNSQQTPSSKDGIPTHIERLHRINGTVILSQASFLLRTSPSICATSTTIFHRFFHRKSLKEYSVWSVCMACTMLACKVEEDVRRLREIVLVYYHIYRRFRLSYGIGDGGKSLDSGGENTDSLKVATSDLLQNKLTEEEKQNILRYIRPLPHFEPVYMGWENELKKMENVMLRELGFTLYWIPESHPHVFLLYFIKVLEIEQIGQIAWNYCNDSCRLDLCVRVDPEVTACAAIYIACIDENIMLPMEPRPWYHVFIGENNNQNLANTCNAILSLSDENLEGYRDAMRTFIVSLVEGGSFNDPGSFLWESTD